MTLFTGFSKKKEVTALLTNEQLRLKRFLERYDLALIADEFALRKTLFVKKNKKLPNVTITTTSYTREALTT